MVEMARIGGCHQKPLDGDYGEVFEAVRKDVLTVSGLPGFEVRVDDILT
jgi:hypothetical protein